MNFQHANERCHIDDGTERPSDDGAIIGVLKCTEEPDVFGVESDAQGFLNRAEGLYRGVNALRTEDLLPASHFLACWVTELALKSFLYSIQETKKTLYPIRHDLEKLWEMCAHKGLQIEPSAPVWCQQLNSIHNGPSFHSRYPTSMNGYVAPSIESLVYELQSLLHTTKKAILT